MLEEVICLVEQQDDAQEQQTNTTTTLVQVQAALKYRICAHLVHPLDLCLHCDCDYDCDYGCDSPRVCDETPRVQGLHYDSRLYGVGSHCGCYYDHRG